MYEPPAQPPFQETANAEVRHRWGEARPGNIKYDIEWAWHKLTFPVRALASWRKNRRRRGNPWSHDRQQPG